MIELTENYMIDEYEDQHRVLVEFQEMGRSIECFGDLTDGANFKCLFDEAMHDFLLVDRDPDIFNSWPDIVRLVESISGHDVRHIVAV